MDWSKGFSAVYYACFVDKTTWKDTERFEILSGSIKRTSSGILQSADIDCVNYDESTEMWIRVYLETKQSGSSDRVALFTGLATAPQSEVNGTLRYNSLDCYSVLKAAQDVALPIGWYAPSGAKGADLVQNLLSEYIPAPVEVIGDSPKLSQYIIAEDNENYLSMAEKVLAAINWRLRLTGDGSITICEYDPDPVATFDPLYNDSIKPKLKIASDWYSCPNVFRAVQDELSAVARDDSEDSPLSTVNRDREVWMEERDCDLANNETLAEYARRRLLEEQMHYVTINYDRRFHPDVVPSDVIQLHYPSHNLSGLFCVSSQSITLRYGAETSEEVVQA